MKGLQKVIRGLFNSDNNFNDLAAHLSCFRMLFKM